MQAPTYHSALQAISVASTQMPRGFFQDLPVIFFKGLVTRSACLDPAAAGDVSAALNDLRDGPEISALVDRLMVGTGAPDLRHALLSASANPNDADQQERLSSLFRLVSLTNAGSGALERAYRRLHQSLALLEIDPVAMSVSFAKQSIPDNTSVHRNDMAAQIVVQSRLAIGVIVGKLGLPGVGLAQKVTNLTTSEAAQFPVTQIDRDAVLTKLALLTTCIAINPNAYPDSDKALISDLTRTLVSDYLAPAPVEQAIARIEHLESERRMGNAFPGDGPYH